MPAKIFQAITLEPGMWDVAGPTVERRRALEFVNRYPTSDMIAWAVGPVGAGKTTFALQWAQSLSVPVQYITARPLSLITGDIEESSDELGNALAYLFNLCSDTARDPSEEEIRHALDLVVRLTSAEPGTFILDDLERLRRSSMMLLQRMLIEVLPRLSVNRALVISRTIDSTILGGFQALRTLRMVLPSTFPFDRVEAEQAHQAGVFGSASLEDVESARESSRGWILGMLTELGESGGRTISKPDLCSYLMNDFLVHQPTPILQIMMASAALPFNHEHIWERWFTRAELPQWIIPSTVTQLPTREIPGLPKAFELVPVMKDALLELGAITVPDQDLIGFLEIAIEYYVQHDFIEQAVSLANEHRLLPFLLTCVKTLCSGYAEDESWIAIADIVRELPEDLIIQDPDLTFWYFHGLVAQDHWAEMNRILRRVSKAWRESPDHLIQGRSLLLESWHHYMLNDGLKSVELAESSFELLPEDASQERLWAAGTTIIANLMAGDLEAARDWSAKANYENSFLPNGSRWYHNNSGPLQYSWMAIFGLVAESYEFCLQQVKSFAGTGSSEAVRYLMLMAQIDTERFRFDSATSLLEHARQLMEDRYSQPHHLRVIEANLLRAQGNLDAALDLFADQRSATRHRFDQFSRDVFTRGSLALDLGDLNEAEILLSGTPSGLQAWPKNFGDAHPSVIAARLLHLRGQHEDAIRMLENVTNDARHRRHRYYVVDAQSTLAYIHEQLGQSKPRDRAVKAAVEAGGTSGYQLAFIVDGTDIRNLSPETSTGEEEGAENIPIVRQASVERLTQRELEILNLTARTYSNKQIAEAMFISVSTVKNHLASAYTKLGTNNRRAAVRVALDLNLIDVPE